MDILGLSEVLDKLVLDKKVQVQEIYAKVIQYYQDIFLQVGDVNDCKFYLK